MRRAYGWHLDGTLRDDEASNLREWAQHTIDGGTMRRLATDLNERGVPTVTGKTWAPRTLSRALTNPRIAGLREHRGDIVDAPDIAPIITRAQWEQITAIFADDERRKFAPNRNTESLLGGGLARCGRCGKPLYAVTGGIYGCSAADKQTCPGVTIQAHIIEPEVSERVLVRITSEVWRAAITKAASRAPEHYQLIIDDAEQRIVRLATEFGGGANEAAFDAGLAAARDVQATAQRNLDLVSAVTRTPELTTEDIVEWWADVAALDDKRDVIALVLDHVTVKPRSGNPTVADRLNYTWRD